MSQCKKRLNWAKEKKDWTVDQWSEVLFSKVLFSSFGNQGPRVWRKMDEEPSCLKSSMKYPQSVMIWGTMSSAGVGNLCFLKYKVTATVYQNVLEDFMIPSSEGLYGGTYLIFQQDLAHAKYWTLTYHLKSTLFWLIWYDPNFFLSSVKTFWIYVFMSFQLEAQHTVCKNKQIYTWNHLNCGLWTHNLFKFNFLKGIMEMNKHFHDSLFFFWKGSV